MHKSKRILFYNPSFCLFQQLRRKKRHFRPPQNLKLQNQYFLHVFVSLLTPPNVKIFVLSSRLMQKHLDSFFFVVFISGALEVSHTNISNRDGSQNLANYLDNVNSENFRFCGGQFRETRRTIYKTDFVFFFLGSFHFWFFVIIFAYWKAN